MLLSPWLLTIFLCIAVLMISSSLSIAAAPLPTSITFSTPYYHITVRNVSQSDMISKHYRRPNMNHVDYFLNNNDPNNSQTFWGSHMSKHNIPVWERNPASNYDDRIVWSPLMDNFSMPFFSMQFRQGTSSSSSSDQQQERRSVAKSASFLIASNGFLTPSLQGDLCSGFFCHDYYFPYLNRSIEIESDIVPEVGLFVYDLDPRNSSSRHPISVFLQGDCVPPSPSSSSASSAQEHFTTNVETCDSIVVDFDDVPEYGRKNNGTISTFSGQAQLYRNSTVIMRYLSFPPISPLPWWYFQFGVEKAHPSCGLINNNGFQVANTSQYCRDAYYNATAGVGDPTAAEYVSTPLYNEMIFHPNIETDTHDCHDHTSCDTCVSSSASSTCVWCEGSVPQKESSSSSSSTHLTTGRCVPQSLAHSICGAWPELAVDPSQSAIPQAQSTCSDLRTNYALRQEAYRTFYYPSHVDDVILEEWRDGLWATGPSRRDRYDVGLRTGLPTWSGNTDREMISKNQIEPEFVTIIDTKKDIGTTFGTFKKLKEDMFVPSEWWKDNTGRCKLFSAQVRRSLVSCTKYDNNNMINLYAFANMIHLYSENLTIIESEGKAFDTRTTSLPPLQYCIRRNCSSQPADGVLTKQGKCPTDKAARDATVYCDGFSMAIWRGRAIPASDGYSEFTLAATVGEFGHIFAHLEIQSPLGNVVPNVLPKSVQHFFMDYDGGRYSSPMRRWSGSGLSVGWAPVTTCPATCPLGSGCDTTTGACRCSPQYDLSSFCTQCKDSYSEWRLSTRFTTGTILNRTSENSESKFVDTVVSRCVPCPKCQNGGYCNSSTKSCVCPFPFEGVQCEINCASAFANYNNDTATSSLSKASCDYHPYSSWICGRCVPTSGSSPSTFAPPAPSVRYPPEWITMLSWLVMAFVVTWILYGLCKKAMSGGYDEDDENGGNDNDNEDQERSGDDNNHQRPLLGNHRRRGRGGRGRRGDFSDDSHSGDEDTSDEDYSDDDDETERVDDHLAELPPKMRVQILEQRIKTFPPHVIQDYENRIKTPESRSYAKWLRRLQEAKKLEQAKSNPLGIALDKLLVPPLPPPRSLNGDDDDNDDDDDEQDDYRPPSVPKNDEHNDNDNDDDDQVARRRKQENEEEEDDFFLPPNTKVRVIPQNAPGVVEQQKEAANGMRVEASITTADDNSNDSNNNTHHNNPQQRKENTTTYKLDDDSTTAAASASASSSNKNKNDDNDDLFVPKPRIVKANPLEDDYQPKSQKKKNRNKRRKNNNDDDEDEDLSSDEEDEKVHLATLL